MAKNFLPQSLAAEWHPTKNGILKFSNFSVKSVQKVWWVCSKQHEWEARIDTRVLGTACPVCSNRKILVGFNDLATTSPELSLKWNYVKNFPLTPLQLVQGSGKKVWWVDEYSHEWEATVASQSVGKGCPFCSHSKILIGFNDLATTHPELATEWHPTKNEALSLNSSLTEKKRNFFWLGSCSHEWEASISDRKRGRGCPVCSGKKIVSGFNDLKSFYPEVAAQWHPTKNGVLTPSEVSKKSGKAAWWLCVEGHEWEAPIANRTEKESQCPVCSGYVAWQGKTDLQTMYPEVAAQWHPTKNGVLTPSEVSKKSGVKIWWMCEVGHEWEAYVYNRTGVKKTLCPKCMSGKASSAAEKELYEILTTLGLVVEPSDRAVLRGREIDLLIRSKKIGIEFNGLYWHSENAGKDKDYHLAKYVDSGLEHIQLLQIWEDDWNLRKLQVIRTVVHKLGMADELPKHYPEFAYDVSKVFARKTVVVDLTTLQAKQFLEQNHIQGFASGSHYIGLEEAGGVVRAVMVLKKETGNTLNIVRYATAGSVTGGFTKLLTYATRTYQPDSFITFADHTISDGGLYENNGFIADKELPPDYMYIVKHVRRHKFGYRLKKFRTDPNLLWEENLTERELALLNNIPRIWDAGKTRYKLIVTSRSK